MYLWMKARKYFGLSKLKIMVCASKEIWLNLYLIFSFHFFFFFLIISCFANLTLSTGP